MSGSQVSQPNYVNTPQTQAATTDYAGIMNQGYQNQLGAYNTQMDSYNNTVGGLFKLGAAGVMMSDIRVKDDIKKVGTIKGYNLYEFTYNFDPEKQIHYGLMAQEVEKIRPEVVIDTESGVKMVDYRKALEDETWVSYSAAIQARHRKA